MADYTVSAKITGDSSGFSKAFSTAQKAADTFETRMNSISSKLKSVGGSLSSFGAKMSIGITLPVVAAGKSMVTAASDFDENLNKVNVAFGNSADKVTEWAETATKQFGLSKNQALEATSLFGDMATSMGLTQPAAADMSTSLAGLAGDLASFKNIDIDQAMTALSGVFTGETESLKQLGIVMTETNLEEFAAQTGQVYSQMSQAEKVQLRYNYVMAMSANAQGDYARTSDGTANSIRTFQGAVDNLQIALGQHLLPILTPLIQKATEMVEAFANADPQLQQLVLKIGAIAAVAGPVLTVIGTMISSIGSITGAIGALGGQIAAVGGMKAALTGVFTAISGPVGIAVAAITALVAAFAYLMNTNEEFKSSIMSSVSTIQSSLYPIMEQLGALFTQIGNVLMTTITSVLQALAPVLSTIVSIVAQLFATLAPLISQLISALAPVITQIISSVSNIVSAILPPLITIINAILSAVQALIPPIASILSTVISVITDIMSAVSPIISFVAGIIGDIMGIISPIVSFIAGIISAVVSVISGIISTVSSVFSSVYNIVSSIMSSVGSFISGIFDGIQSAWNGLTGFVSGVFDGISSAVSSLVDGVKGFVNGVIGGINAAIGIINKIPGVSIGEIPQLAGGTQNWQGGFAYMNEGGRGELTYLPNGAQVIPHDISVRYAKESARANAALEPLDMVALGKYIVSAVTEQGAQISDGLCAGMSRIRFTADDREIVRYIESLGFSRG